MELIKGFNYATISTMEKPQYKESYEEWHDLIDIRVPGFKDPSILLCKRVPIPLWGVNPRSILTKLDKNWWDRTRQKVYESHNYHCHCCGTHKAEQGGWRKLLDAHEYYDIDYKTGEVRLKMITCLCTRCHNYIHFGRMTAKYEQGEFDEKEYYATISHGNTILQKAGLPAKELDPNINDNIYNVPWDKFNLILNINGEEKRFYSLYENEEELMKNYK